MLFVVARLFVLVMLFVSVRLFVWVRLFVLYLGVRFDPDERHKRRTRVVRFNFPSQLRPENVFTV